MAGERDDGRPTVLVVDDDPAAADRHGEWLAGRYDVRTVHEVGAAVETLRGDPDAIDAVLPNRRNVLRPERSEDELATSDEPARLERDVERLARRLSLHPERLGTENRRPNAVGT